MQPRRYPYGAARIGQAGRGCGVFAQADVYCPPASYRRMKLPLTSLAVDRDYILSNIHTAAKQNYADTYPTSR